jgi:3-phenylpropionate/trans-cinnamate dioxygenase ferredoxin subunit
MPHWIRACATDDIDLEDLIGFDHGGANYAIYRSPDDTFYATAGRCTHEAVKLCDGLVMGHLIECPKHNGQFDYRTGQATRAPACTKLQTFPVKIENGAVFIAVE